MGHIRLLEISGYRSIDGDISIAFPDNTPVILVGENNAGKTNIARALNLVLGESWPGSYSPDDHDFYGRGNQETAIAITAHLKGVTHTDRSGGSYQVETLALKSDGRRTDFSMTVWKNSYMTYPSNDTRGQCTCIYVGADRRLDYQLSYTNKFTFLSKLMRSFHDRLVSDQTRLDRLRSTFSETKDILFEVPEFATFANELRERVSELSSNLDYALEIDFSAYDPSNFFHALRVHAREGDQVRTLEELGSGQGQLLALSFIQAYATTFHNSDGLVLVIDEPEANLHPLAQVWLARKLRDLAATGVQVVITTHSAAFLDIARLPGLVLVHKIDGRTDLVQMDAEALAKHCRDHGAERASADTVLDYYATAATQEILEGFFARKVVLVEGPSEALALPIYLEQAGLIPAKEGVAVIPVHGIGNLAKWWRLFTAYGIPTFVIFDNDARDDDNTTKRSDILRTLDVASERHADILRTREWLVDERFCVFGVDFETTMRSAFDPGYRALEDAGRSIHGGSKPLLARYVASHLKIHQFPDGAAKLYQLAENVRSLEC